MRMQIYPDLYQFTDVMEPIKLSMHQYLLLTGEPVLIQTGAISQTRRILPRLEELLGERSLKYILMSHFESDECGGVSLVLQKYPDAICVCSEVTARQLLGFGLAGRIEIRRPGETLDGKDFAFKVIGYPSEMHMWEGVLFMETERGIFFSSDLMFRMGESHGQTIISTWSDAVKNSGARQLPSPNMQEKLTSELASLRPVFVASGHGPCIKILQ